MIACLSFSENGTSWPYGSDPKDPTYRHDPIDLRNEPDRVDELPEVKRAPDLALFLQKLNSRGSIFRTLGCNYSERADHKRGHGAWGYVHIAFADDAVCKHLDYYGIVFMRLSQKLHARFPFIDFDTEVSATMEQFSIGSVKVGWTMCLDVTVWRPDPIQARRDWGRLLDAISPHLAQMKVPKLSRSNLV